MTLSRLLICTDLDRTLIPNGPQPQSAQARNYLDTLVRRPEVTLVFVSGRHRALVEEAIATYELPVPDFVIGDVGTTIYRVGPSHAWSRLESWERQIARDWAGQSHADLKSILNDISVLKPQEHDRQNRLKLSYYVPLEAETDQLSDLIQQRLQAADVSARLVWSEDDIEHKGLLDILPLNASKLHAIEALMEQQKFDLDNTVFCGDSGNDMEVLISPIPAVLVANGRAKVKAAAIEMTRHAGTDKQLYIASGNLLNMNGNYAAGMLEGIVHFYPDTLDWFQQATVPDNRIT